MEEVFLKNVSVTDIGFVIFLKSVERARVLPIFVGLVEAQSMSMTLSGEKLKRPMAHDLIMVLFKSLEVALEKVEIVKFSEDTFYADIYLKCIDGKEIVVDSRPTDAVILSMLSKSKIYVKASIMEQQGIDDEGVLKIKNDHKNSKGHSETSSNKISENKNEELGVYWRLLEEAIKEERYEEASRLKRKIDLIINDGEKQ